MKTFEVYQIVRNYGTQRLKIKKLHLMFINRKDFTYESKLDRRLIVNDVTRINNAHFLIFIYVACFFVTGVLESPKMALDETILLSKLTDTLRAQMGVLELDLED